MDGEDNMELGKEKTPWRISPWILALFFESGLGIAAILLGSLLGPWPWPGARVGESHSMGYSLFLGSLGLLASLPPLIVAVAAYRFDWQPIRNLEQQTQSALGFIICGRPIWQLLLVCMAAGIGEELLFRGWLQRGLEMWLKEFVFGWMVATVSLLAAALIFGICHAMSLTYAVLAGLAGLYFGGLMLATDGVECPISAHASYDFLMILWMRNRWAQPNDFGGTEAVSGS